jgi:recombination associated protein RdgC
VPPLGQHGSEFVHAANGFIMLCAKRQEKVLPAAVVNEMLADKVAEIKARDGRPVGRKERVDLKDEITFELMPRAFARSSTIYAYIDTREGLLLVNSSSAKRAEELMSYLRETLGSLPVIPVTAKNIPLQVMTHWLKEGEHPEGFAIGAECELRDPSDESSVIRCKNQDLASEEINAHLQAGMLVSKLALEWQGGINCLVDTELAVKRIGFGDLMQEKIDREDAEDAAQQFDADFTLMTAEFADFIKSLMQIFGGEDLSDCEQSE